MSVMEERKLKIVKYELEDMYDVIPYWNDYCSDIGSSDHIYNNDEEFFKTFFDDPYEAIQRTYYGAYRLSDDLVKFNGYGNLESFNYERDYIDYGELAEWFLENHEEECEEWFNELYDELEEEAMEIAMEEINQLEEATSDSVWNICISVADEFGADVDELFDKIMEKLDIE